jgi:fatty-acid desaturase
MTFVSNYFASKRWEKVGRQELHSAPYKQEIDPWCKAKANFFSSWVYIPYPQAFMIMMFIIAAVVIVCSIVIVVIFAIKVTMVVIVIKVFIVITIL